MSLKAPPHPDEVFVHTSSSRPYRYIIYLSMFLMGVISYSDRAVLSAAMPEIVKEFSLNSVTTGWLMSSFFWSYFLLHIPSAFLVNRYGSRRVGTWAVSFWSLALMAVSLATTVPQLFATRILLGACESPSFTLGLKSVGKWAPASEYGTAMTIGKAGVPFGLAVGALLGGALVVHTSWRITFLMVGIIGLLWGGGWYVLFRDQPGPEEKQAQQPVQDNAGIVGKALRDRTYWMMVVQQCAGAYSTFLFMSWMPMFYVKRFHLGTGTASQYFALSYLIATPLSALISSAFRVWSGGRTLRPGSRRLFILLLSLMATVIALTPLITNVLACALVSGFGMALIIATLGENTALFMDYDPSGVHTTQLYAVALTCSGLTGIAAPAITGYLIAGGESFGAAFILAAVFLVLGALSLFCARERS